MATTSSSTSSPTSSTCAAASPPASRPPYGAEALEEFFAVGAEAFFVAAEELEREEPRLYRLLAEFFRQDPAEDKRNGGLPAPVVAEPRDP